VTAFAVAVDAQDMAMRGWNLHPLMGEDAGRWSVWASDNWRLTFGFERGDAEDVDYQDYH
jgi:proteic killer suppression protein